MQKRKPYPVSRFRMKKIYKQAQHFVVHVEMLDKKKYNNLLLHIFRPEDLIRSTFASKVICILSAIYGKLLVVLLLLLLLQLTWFLLLLACNLQCYTASVLILLLLAAFEEYVCFGKEWHGERTLKKRENKTSRNDVVVFIRPLFIESNNRICSITVARFRYYRFAIVWCTRTTTIFSYTVAHNYHKYIPCRASKIVAYYKTGEQKAVSCILQFASIMYIYVYRAVLCVLFTLSSQHGCDIFV